MRYTIWLKDDSFEVEGERIEMDPSVVVIEQQYSLPLAYNYNYDKGSVGKVEDVRVEDGEITGEVTFFEPTWNDEMVKDLGLRLGGYYTDVEYSEDGTKILSCELKGVSFCAIYPGFPKP